MEEKSKKTLAIVLFSGIAGLIIYAVITHFVISEKFNNPDIEKKHAVGLITGYQSGARTSPSFYYKFYVDGRSYESVHDVVSKLGLKSSEELKKYIGKKYKVWYVVENPDYSRLIMSMPVHDSIRVYSK